ncbi:MULTISPECIES: DinB family protein [Acidobacteriaceae]|uniref:DinB family protein n=1 Tax=Acidobacteriaceae TaxID=204434 RepID=UPI00131D4473|nr:MULTISPECIES: DinB family protein [Acidobacteriaceae]MDW5267376.1 DinB family protein [Edaphobacter sp.]
MGVTYTHGTKVELLDPVELSKQLTAVVRQALPWLQALTEASASRPEKTGKWCAKEVMGHLTDSAINNHARVMRLQLEAGPNLSGYEQMAWVSLQHYADREWGRVLEVWATLNEYFAWAVSHIDKAHLANMGTVEGDELTLGFLIEDYIAHMEHHLRALKAWAI